MSDQMNFSVDIHIPGKSKYSGTFEFATVEEAATKINNNLYLKSNNQELAKDITENGCEKPNYAYWCNEINGAHAKVSLLAKVTGKALNWDKELIELNANESAVYNCFLQGGDEYEDRMCLHSTQVHVDGLSENQIKGYLSALDKKGVISNEELPSKVMAWLTTGTYEELRALGFEC
tara:strand:- start:680 stop:1210 length:531 start_codon:yes stop_codon:yes gene_type:complete